MSNLNASILDEIRCLCAQLDHLEQIANSTVDWSSMSIESLVDIKEAYAITVLAVENAITSDILNK